MDGIASDPTLFEWQNVGEMKIVFVSHVGDGFSTSASLHFNADLFPGVIGA